MLRKSLFWICLITFLPSAIGCSSRRTIPIDSDSAERSPAELEGPVHVEGYTLSDGTRVAWKGHVVKVLPDSLEFRSSGKDHLRKGSTFGQQAQPAQDRPLIFRLASANVAELHAVKGMLVPSLLLALVGLVTLMIVSVSLSGGIYGD